jgi:hypothetical protein
MTQLKNVMEIFKLLEKSNCRECNEATCLAFAAAVFKGQKQLGECPRLDSSVVAAHGGGVERQKSVEQEQDELMAQMKEKISSIDLSSAAARVGGNYSNGKLTIKILGKDFSVDDAGNITTDIHVHPWVVMPLFSHIVEGTGVPVSGKWVPLRELKNGQTWYRLFGQRCEKPLKRIADIYTDLFEDMIHIFNGKPVENHYESDISLVLYPLPKVPILICYWKPDDGLESDLNLFFDATAEEHLNIESIYALGAGLVMMFEKIGLRHGI